MKTVVPADMMKEGWTADYPCNVKNWSVERDVFTWLRFGKSIEEVIEMYEGWLTKKKATTWSEKLNAYWLAWQYGSKCHHHVNTLLNHCVVCEEQNKSCIQYLKELKVRVIEYNEAKQQNKTNRLRALLMDENPADIVRRVNEWDKSTKAAFEKLASDPTKPIRV